MLFPKDLWDNVLQCYLIPGSQQTLNLLPSRKSKFESTIIINKKLIVLFASWIDKKSPPYSSPKEVKYEFKLLYRSSRDGLNLLNLNVDDIYKRTTESFIFNISNRNDVNTAQLSYVINNDYDHAINCYSSYLPYFGHGPDIYFYLSYKEGYICRGYGPKTYKNINIVKDLKFDELEVFQV